MRRKGRKEEEGPEKKKLSIKRRQKKLMNENYMKTTWNPLNMERQIGTKSRLYTCKSIDTKVNYT